MNSDICSLAYYDSEHDFAPSLTRSLFHIIQQSLPGPVLRIFNDEDEALNFAKQQSGNDFTSEFNLSLTPNSIYRILGGRNDNPVGILCDAGFCSKLMNELSKNTIGPVWNVVNKERENDPGCITDDIHTHDYMKIAQDNSIDEIKYSRYTDESRYEHKVCSLLSVHIDTWAGMVFEKSENDPIISYDFNRKISQPYLLNKIKGLMKKRPTYPNILSIQAAFFAKRCGDWLQVLSCMDTKRPYKIEDTETNLSNAQIYFCSKDRVAIAFALYSGISCIYERPKENSFKIFQSPRRMVSEREHEFKINKTDLYNENVVFIRNCVRICDIFLIQLQTEMMKIEYAHSISDIKTALKYAIHYSNIRRHFNQVVRNREIIDTFLINKDSDIFRQYNNYMTINTLIGKKGFDKRYASFSLDTPIYDERYVEFDPCIQDIKIENNRIAYNVLFCIGVLHSLLREKTEILGQFVNICVDKIIELAPLDIIKATYRLYKEYLATKNSNIYTQIGGSQVSNEDLKQIGTVLTQYLLYRHDENNYGDDFLDCSEFQPLEWNIEWISGEFEGEGIIELIITKYHVRIPEYAKYMKKMKYKEEKRHIYEFLKIQKINTTYRIPQNRMIIARKRQGKNKTRRYQL